MKTLNELKHIPKSGREFWMARDIMPHLGYDTWENFANAISRAKQSCETSGEEINNHFRDATKVVEAGSRAKVPRADCYLSRFACYLIAMNGDPRKPEIAIAQQYFAIQTRKQELAEQAPELEQRLELRDRVKTSVKKLGDAAKESGVKNYGRFHNAGYEGLYGMSFKQVRATKKLPEDEDLLDCISRAELAANEFKNTQTELRLRKEQVDNEDAACKTHQDVGQGVRKAMKELGGKYPEELPREESLKKLGTNKKSLGPDK